MKNTYSSIWLAYLLILFFPFNIHAQSDPIPGGCGNVGPNLVVNPEFEDGNVGFTNSFNFNQDYTCSYGDYTIATTVNDDPAVTCYNAPGFNLQTIWAVSDRNNPGIGSFMIVDPCDTAGTACSTTDLSGIAWQQTIDVCPNNTYTFSVMAKNIYFQEAINYPGSDTLPDFELTINGDTIAGYYVDGVLSTDGSYELPKMPMADSAVWIQISGTWDSGPNTTATLVMKNLVPGSQGNDLAIDGIFFGLCGKDVSLNIGDNIPQCAANGTEQAVTFTPSPETLNSGWLLYEWYRDGVLVQSDANGTFTTPLDPVNKYYGEYTMVAYETPTASSCGHQSKSVTIYPDTSQSCLTFPVELIAFDAKQQEQSAVLTWTTASELNNQGFEIEISEDGENFTNIGFVPGNGTTQDLKTYQFITAPLFAQTYVFRLKQIDTDGKFSYSDNQELTIQLWNAHRLAIFPNPLTYESKVILEVEETQYVSISLFSFEGKEIKTLYKGVVEASAPIELPVSSENLASGLYLLEARGARFRHPVKIMIP